MKRVVLVHWNRGEAQEQAGRLRRAGYNVTVCCDANRGGDSRAWRADPPDAFVIDLSRLPSHGKQIGLWVRGTRAVRAVPIVFVGGAPEKVAQARAALPDAAYTEWGRIRSDLKRAIAHPPAEPDKPEMSAGYSGTPLPRKLGIKAGATVALLGAPEGFDRTLGALPDGARVVTHARGRAGTIVLFVRSRAELARRFGAAQRVMADRGALWIGWPKRASGVATDLGEADVRAYGLARGLVDYKVCAIDATWSGLCFARRHEDGR